MNPEAPGTPTPAAPEAPAAPVAPVAPVAPEAPTVTPQTTTAPEPSADELDDNEWEDAQDEIYPGIKAAKKKDSKQDDPNKPEKTAEEIAAEEAAKKDPAANAEETDAEKVERESREAAAQNDGKPNAAARDARIAARESAQQVEKMQSDVREKMFADLPTTLQDADGDPINGIEDVQKLINPRTQEPFTEEEAGMWLLSAQQKFNESLVSAEKQIEKVANVNMDLKDQADRVTEKYGKMLAAKPELRDKLWLRFEKTLVKDGKSELITDMPFPLEEFYDTALEPYLEIEKQAVSPVAPVVPGETAPTAEEKAAADAKAKKEADEAKQQRRADRSDIYAPNNAPQPDDEEKEWGEAAKEVFGDALKIK